MNKKLLIIFLIAFISFINNLLCNFNYLIDLFTSLPLDFYFTKLSSSINLKDYIKIMYSLVCYFTFFITDNPLSVFKV